MSSSDTQVRFKMGAHVEATDGRCGHVTRVIIDPVAQALTHIAVEPGLHLSRTRLVPLHHVRTIAEDVVRLSLTKAEFE